MPPFCLEQAIRVAPSPNVSPQNPDQRCRPPANSLQQLPPVVYGRQMSPQCMPNKLTDCISKQQEQFPAAEYSGVKLDPTTCFTDIITKQYFGFFFARAKVKAWLPFGETKHGTAFPMMDISSWNPSAECLPGARRALTHCRILLQNSNMSASSSTTTEIS